MEKIKRRSKQNKSEVLTLRLTPEESDFLSKLKNDLQFETNRDLVLFGMEVVKSLKEWDSSNYKFFVGKGKPEENDYREVEFELKPDFSKGGE